MPYKNQCQKTIMLAHAGFDAVPIGPATGGKNDTEHECSGARGHLTPEHYCGCGVSWDDNGKIIRAPWMETE